MKAKITKFKSNWLSQLSRTLSLRQQFGKTSDGVWLTVNKSER